MDVRKLFIHISRWVGLKMVKRCKIKVNQFLNAGTTGDGRQKQVPGGSL